MSQRNILLAVCAVVIIGAGFWFYTSQPANEAFSPQTQNSSADQAKIDIDSVCRGALAYMTFPDAAAAEIFVTECKEGKHPEVIEQYKVQMGITNDATI